MNKFFILVLCLMWSCISVFCLEYDYSSTKCIPIILRVVKEISTKKPIYEGQKIQLVAVNAVYNDNNLILNKGDIIQGQIETIITSGMNGFPAEIILDNFEIPNIRQSQLVGTYTKAGVNRCLWVYPLKWAMTPLYPSGSLTNFIKGGHARIKPSDIITIYYYPEWK